MRVLLTSAGIRNGSIHDALVDLLDKPIAESNALFIPTALYPFPGGPGMAWRAICGKASSPLCELGWKSLGVLELTALPSIEEATWVPTVRDADALLVGGGDPLFLANWMRRSGLTRLLPTLRSEAVYVGVSAGSIAAASTFVETYNQPPRGNDGPLKSEDIVFATSQGDVHRILVTGHGAGLVDFAVIPHLEHADHPDASFANAERWAARIPAPTYAIDDETAIRVVDGAAQVVSEGHWKLFQR
ncbi:MAG: peptidase E [Chloroflexi bacterium]|nr:MAG: peptidase E [Chloroflexota bacterium]